MAQIDEHLAYYREFIAQMKGDIELMESGKWQMFELKDGTRVDKTGDWIKDLKRRVANLQNIVAAYERTK